MVGGGSRAAARLQAECALQSRPLQSTRPRAAARAPAKSRSADAGDPGGSARPRAQCGAAIPPARQHPPGCGLQTPRVSAPPGPAPYAVPFLTLLPRFSQ